MSPPQLKEFYTPQTTHKAFFTGGNVQLTSPGDKLLCQCTTTVKIVDVQSGIVSGFIGEEESLDEDSVDDLVITFGLSKDDKQVVTAHKSGLLKLWDLSENKLLKQWKSIHKGHVAVIEFSTDSDVLATGGSDSSLKLWNLKHHSCTHNLKGVQGVFSIVKFFMKSDVPYIFGAGDDYCIKGWNIVTSQIKKSLSGHYSKITGLEISHCSSYIVSGSRDKVLILWEFSSGKQLKVIPLYESIEALVLLPKKITIPGADVQFKNSVFVAVAGEKGSVKIWDVKEARQLFTQKNSLISPAKEQGGLAVTQLLYNKATNTFAVVSADHNIIFHLFDDFSCRQQLIGFSDEILDLVILGIEETHLAVATNSNDIKLYNLSNMNCQLLVGHTDLVVALASTPANPDLFASSSKDNSMRLWCLKDGNAYCVASGMIHSSSVGAVAFSQLKQKFVLSGSQDTTLKLWKLPKELSHDETVTLTVKMAKVVHEKEINEISVAPNDKIIATASMDKTAKLWSAEDLTLLGTLRGHKRGVWSVNFSSMDQVVLTTSADAMIKIWAISDLSCLKTLEGHDASVMKGLFVSRGMQVLSIGGDGLLKLWNLKTSECINSFDHHYGKIWAIAISKSEDKLITGGSDSQLIIWKDVTEEKKLEEVRKLQEKALMEQQLANLMQADDLLNALKLALTLDRPATVLKIIQDVIKRGETGLPETILQLDNYEKKQLMTCVAHWNTNSKFCYPAQVIVSIMLDGIVHGNLEIERRILETIIAYTEKHFKRLSEEFQALHILDYTKLIMKPTSKNHIV